MIWLFFEFVSNYDPLQSPYLSSKWVGALKRWIPKIESMAYQSPYSPVIIQGTDDGTVDWRHNMRVLKARFDNPTIYYLEGAKHHLVNEHEDYRARILEIFDQHLP